MSLIDLAANLNDPIPFQVSRSLSGIAKYYAFQFTSSSIPESTENIPEKVLVNFVC